MNHHDRHDAPSKRIANLRKESACPASKVSTDVHTDQEQSSASRLNNPTVERIGKFLGALFAASSTRSER